MHHAKNITQVFKMQTDMTKALSCKKVWLQLTDIHISTEWCRTNQTIYFDCQSFVFLQQNHVSMIMYT